ncbi:MAG: DUF1592 domain-containing protein [Myxococcota bacterium]
MKRLIQCSAVYTVVALLALLPGCERLNAPSPLDELAADGATSQEEGGGLNGIPPAEFPASEPGAVSIRRLTQVQLDNAFKMLFGEGLTIASLGEPDLVLGGLASVGASTSTLSPRGVETLEKLTVGLVQQVLADDAMRDALLVCTPSSTQDEACFSEILSRLGRLAWRRSLDADERDALVALARTSAEALDSVEDGLVYAISALLQSPKFLYRFELGALDDATGERRFTSVDLASRLSFFLWNTPPDTELLDAAEVGDLRDDDALRAQAERLLDDPRARGGFENFVHEYLHLKRLAKTSKDPLLFDRYYPAYAEEAREEVLRLYDYIVFTAGADIRKALTTRVTHLSPALAALYGVPAPAGEGFSRVVLPEESQRAGLLGQAAFLGSHSHPVSSSATLRGKAVRTILLCQSIPEPPVDVDTSIPEPSGTTLTLRDRVAEHLENPACAGCHQLTDPIGLAMENYDSLGTWRDTDNGVTIDASGSLDGVDFDGPIGLAESVANHPDYLSCFLQMMVRYATGREETGDESEWHAILLERMEAQGNQVRPLMLDIVMSPLFRQAGELKEVE